MGKRATPEEIIAKLRGEAAKPMNEVRLSRGETTGGSVANARCCLELPRH